MSLFPCPSCQQHIYPDSSHCPHCFKSFLENSLPSESSETNFIPWSSEDVDDIIPPPQNRIPVPSSQTLYSDNVYLPSEPSLQMMYGLPPVIPGESGFLKHPAEGTPMQPPPRSLFRRIWDWCIGLFSKSTQQ